MLDNTKILLQMEFHGIITQNYFPSENSRRKTSQIGPCYCQFNILPIRVHKTNIGERQTIVGIA